ncbi:MAG: hypothetical protein AAF497_14990 [Planctomycetota bacterium]
MTDEFDSAPSATHHRNSWTSLHDYYESEYGQRDAHFRFRYIVNRLLDSPACERFTIGEAFLHGREGTTGRGLYFTNAWYGQLFDVPYVVAYPNINDVNTHLAVDYVHGTETISSHICQPRKEIPCLLSLLDQLSLNTRGVPWRKNKTDTLD